MWFNSLEPLGPRVSSEYMFECWSRLARHFKDLERKQGKDSFPSFPLWGVSRHQDGIQLEGMRSLTSFLTLGKVVLSCYTLS